MFSIGVQLSTDAAGLQISAQDQADAGDAGDASATGRES